MARLARRLCGFVALTAALAAVHCARTQPAKNVAPSPGPTGWPSYFALDYGKAGQPQLTAAQTTLVRRTLSLVKPCQAFQLRYAFPREEDEAMVLYFQNPWEIYSGAQPHVLWTENEYYEPIEGDAFPATGDFPDTMGTAYEVTHQPCATEYVPLRSNFRYAAGPPPSEIVNNSACRFTSIDSIGNGKGTIADLVAASCLPDRPGRTQYVLVFVRRSGEVYGNTNLVFQCSAEHWEMPLPRVSVTWRTPTSLGLDVHFGVPIKIFVRKIENEGVGISYRIRPPVRDANSQP